MQRRTMMAATLAGMLAVSGAWADVSEMSVQVRTAQLRAAPSYLGAIAGTAAYADRVAVLAKQGDWMQVRAGAVTGWVHHSALTTQRIVMTAGAEDVGATASGAEMSLAGKGFNAEVEANFKSKNTEIDFGPIDRMERLRLPVDDLRRFLTEGGLMPKRGES